MRYLQAGNRRLDRLVPVSARWVFIGLAGLMLSANAQAEDLETCMTTLLMQSGNSTTVGEIRERCSEMTHEDAEDDQGVVAERFAEDKEHALEPFTLMAHNPTYFLAAAHNTKGYDPTLFREQYDDPSIKLDKTEAQFQISLKVPLWVGAFNKFDIYAAYTNRSFWQFYNGDVSRPFRETNHEPEVWAHFDSSWEIFGFRNVSNSIGIVHQSNGRGGVLSRSWNRVFANFVFEKDNFAFEFKPWIRISEDDDEDDNPDITDYLGHYELRAAYKRNDHVFSVMSRNNLESGFDKGAVELGWSFPLFNYPYLKGYIQYFRGHGESMIDYDRRVNRIGIGILLNDWL